MKIATATSVLANYLLEDALHTVAQVGFDGVDPWCGRPHMYRRDYSINKIFALKAELSQSGVEAVTAMPAFFRYPFSLSSPVETVRQDSIAYMKDCIDNAAAIGAKNVLIVPGNKVYGQTCRDAWTLFEKSTAEVLEYAQRQSVRLAVEILYEKLSCYMCSCEQAMGLIRDMGSNNLGVVLDTGHLTLSGMDAKRTIETLGDRLFEVHINDNDGISQQNAIPGSGTIDFSSVASILKDTGYNGYLTLEIGWQYSFDPVPALSESLQYVRSLVD